MLLLPMDVALFFNNWVLEYKNRKLSECESAAFLWWIKKGKPTTFSFCEAQLRFGISDIGEGAQHNNYLNGDQQADSSTHLRRVPVHARHHIHNGLTDSNDHAKH